MDVHNQIKYNNINQETIDYMNGIVEEINGRMMLIDSDDKIIYQAGRVPMNRASKVPITYLSKARGGKTQSYSVSGQSNSIAFLSVLVPIENIIYLFQTPLQPIEEAVAISQKFTLYLLFFAFIVALILSWFFSKTITNPLIYLNELARQMGELNFNVKWKENRNDEIGELGEALNFLTEKLKNTIEILEEELQKEKTIDKMRKQFIARVSHELQTPISLIRGYNEALQDGIAIDKNEEKEYFSIIEGETEKMSGLIKDLLDLGQLESGNFKINVETFDIFAMINQHISKFELLYKEKNLRFQIVNEIKYYDVIGDSYRIEQVLTNLLQNAVNHCSFNGLIKVIIQEDENRIKVSIYNEGEQIQEEEKEAIWESFYKVKEEKRGTGLGLAIVKNVLELHGSKYGIENQKSGVIFFFTLNKSFL
jgi:signal transduction histidine kinase